MITLARCFIMEKCILMKSKKVVLYFIAIFSLSASAQLPDAAKWQKYELKFSSTVSYENPVQDLLNMDVTFYSPSGRTKTIHAFWDGDNIWKARFMPDETGT